MKGYWKNEKATSETIRNGWLHTGDMGYIDSDGFLYVLGRFKSLLISDDGEKYSPEGIEETITDRSPLIDQLMLYNNQSKFTTALLVPNKEALTRLVKSKNLNLDKDTGINTIILEIESVINQYKKEGVQGDLFPSRWLPSAIAILDEPFSLENDLLNTNSKIVRAKIVERYRDRIDYLFTPEGKNIINPKNSEAIRSILGINQ
jgi:long-chain acyl-CoA synthetase